VGIEPPNTRPQHARSEGFDNHAPGDGLEKGFLPRGGVLLPEEPSVLETGNTREQTDDAASKNETRKDYAKSASPSLPGDATTEQTVVSFRGVSPEINTTNWPLPGVEPRTNCEVTPPLNQLPTRVTPDTRPSHTENALNERTVTIYAYEARHNQRIVLVPEQKVGLVLGKKGTHAAYFQHHSGTEIHVAR